MNEYKLLSDDGKIVKMYPSTSIVEGSPGWAEYQEWLTAGGIPDPLYTIDAFRQRQKEIIKEAFLNAPLLGLVTSLGHKVNAERLDKDNMQELLDYCTRKSLTTITIRLYDNSFADVTIADLQTIINDIQEFGLGLYQHKWAKEAAIDAAIGGEPDETISSRAGKEVRAGKGGGWKLLCLILHKFDKNHCRKSIEEDEGKDAVS